MINIVHRVFCKLLHLLKRDCYPSEDIIIRLYEDRKEDAILKRIREKDVINVAFFCMSVSLWKYETLFIRMQKDSHFNPLFFISPKMDVWSARIHEIDLMRAYCKKMGFQYIEMDNYFFNKGVDLQQYSIDLAFYTQPYINIPCPEYYYDKLVDNALLCYVPYGYLISRMKHNYVSLLNIIAWKNFFPTTISKKIALTFKPDYDNILDLGYPGYDMYLSCEEYNWGKRGTKKVIWAPHYSVGEGNWIQLSSFMSIKDYMLSLAEEFKDEISVAFKPHPYLFPTLCSKWGKKKAIAYFREWQHRDNCILFEGSAYSLFKSSDAMIHDCASFLLDYMYTQKPCLYVSMTGKLNVETGEDGRDAYDAHYHAKNLNEIHDFIKQVVLESNDPMIVNRLEVLNKHIVKPGEDTSTERLFMNIKESLGVSE